jgi:hypothetical protein
MMITEADVDFVAEIEAADAEALEDWEAKRDDERCPAGCPHFGRCVNYGERW